MTKQRSENQNNSNHPESKDNELKNIFNICDFEDGKKMFVQNSEQISFYLRRGTV